MVEKSQEQNKENESAADGGAAAASTDQQRFGPTKMLYVLYVALTFCSAHCLKSTCIVQSIIFPAPK